MCSVTKSITEERVCEIIEGSAIEFTKMGRKTAVMLARLPNGFEVTVTASCNDPADFNLEIGHDECMGRLKDKIWELEAYHAHSYNAAINASDEHG